MASHSTRHSRLARHPRPARRSPSAGHSPFNTTLVWISILSVIALITLSYGDRFLSGSKSTTQVSNLLDALGGALAAGPRVPEAQEGLQDDVSGLTSDDGMLLDLEVANETFEVDLEERGPFSKINRVYRASEKRGATLLCYLQDPASAKSMAVSQWTKYSDLAKWGWTLDETTQDWSHVVSSFGKGPFAGMSFTNGQALAWRQDEPVNVNGVQYYATNGHFTNVFWPDEGLIFAINNYSPVYQVKEGRGSKDPWKDAQGKALPIVKLRQWSDVNFFSWQKVTNDEQRRNLKWVLRRNIINTTTVQMISEVMKKMGINGRLGESSSGAKIMKAPRWPGFTVKPGHVGFNALLGSPNSYGLAWMLIQHTEQMGHKVIGSITIFDEDTKDRIYAPTMIIQVVDA